MGTKTPELPLAAAQRRLTKRTPSPAQLAALERARVAQNALRVSTAPGRETRRQTVVAMSAQGKSREEIADALRLSPHTVRTDLALPRSREELDRLRSQVREIIMERTAGGLIQGTMGVVRQAIENGDAKSLELSTRAAVNLDKLTASASGESQRVEVVGATPVTHVDLKVLINQVLGRDDRA